MSYDFVVVGGGIGGLTVAALTSARGFSTCLLERQSQVGGCAGRVKFAGHDFEPGMGLYSSWGADEIHRLIFSELSISCPQTTLLDSEFVVRVADLTDVRLYKEDSQFFEEIRRVFPECAENAIEFYSIVSETVNSWRRGIGGSADTTSQAVHHKTGSACAGKTSERFRAFLDAQLRALVHTPLNRCGFLPASLALTMARENLYSINGGVATLAECLAQAIRSAGGSLRLNSPALRLSYDPSGQPQGVDLLSGETVFARRAIVSNMTVWDTYGKLVGLNRTPLDVKKKLSTLQGSGAYVVYASMEKSAASRLPSDHFLCASKWPHDEHGDIDGDPGEFTFASSSSAPPGKCAVTIKFNTEVEDWFSFQSSNEEYEQADQTALERVWASVHQRVPELGADIEVIETATPRDYYESTRRKLGMVLGAEQTPESIWNGSHRTSVPNLFIVGDTAAAAPNVAAVSESALLLANTLTKK